MMMMMMMMMMIVIIITFLCFFPTVLPVSSCLFYFVPIVLFKSLNSKQLYHIHLIGISLSYKNEKREKEKAK